MAELTDASKSYDGRRAPPSDSLSGREAPLILGELAPDSGKVRQGANLQVAYFDQMRNALDLDATLEDFISPGSEWIEIGTTRMAGFIPNRPPRRYQWPAMGLAPSGCPAASRSR